MCTNGTFFEFVVFWPFGLAFWPFGLARGITRAIVFKFWKRIVSVFRSQPLSSPFLFFFVCCVLCAFAAEVNVGGIVVGSCCFVITAEKTFHGLSCRGLLVQQK